MIEVNVSGARWRFIKDLVERFDFWLFSGALLQSPFHSLGDQIALNRTDTAERGYVFYAWKPAALPEWLQGPEASVDCTICRRLWHQEAPESSLIGLSTTIGWQASPVR